MLGWLPRVQIVSNLLINPSIVRLSASQRQRYWAIASSWLYQKSIVLKPFIARIKVTKIVNTNATQSQIK